jgi:hypothetical protein
MLNPMNSIVVAHAIVKAQAATMENYLAKLSVELAPVSVLYFLL